MRFTIRTITLAVTFFAATQVTTTAAVVHKFKIPDEMCSFVLPE
jgi:hypothetical protein